MLVGTPLPVILSVFRALGPTLWIRRVLVRSQEGQSSRAARRLPAALSIAPPGSWRLLALRGRSQEGQLDAQCDVESCRAFVREARSAGNHLQRSLCSGQK